MLIVGMVMGALVGCSTVEEGAEGDGFAERYPGGVVPRAEIVGAEVEEAVPEVLVVEQVPVAVPEVPVEEAVEEAVEGAVEEVPVVEVEKKRKRGWWPFSRKEKKEEEREEVVGAEIEVVETPESELVVAAEEEARPAAPKPAKKLAWKLRFPGVDLLEIERGEPRMMKGWAARVNAADVEWKVTEGNGGDKGETGGLRTSTFLKDYGCDLAVNGAPYSPIELFEDLPQDIIGLQVSNGEVVSRADGNKPVLALGREGKGRVLEAGSYGDGSGLWDAVAGFSVVLRDGGVVGTDGALHPRTAAGVSRDGGTIYLLVIDGRQPGHSEGATTADLGNLLAELGAWDGINLDGGGTTTMVAKGAGGKAEILNTTINGGIPGLERVSGSHLGLRVK